MAENINHPHRPMVGHESSDVNIWAIGKFGAALVIVTLLSIGLLIGVFHFFNTRDGREVKAIDPTRAFPSPQLLPNEPKNLGNFRAAEQHTINGYGWVDQKNGVVHIPIDQAMDLLVKRGVPVRQQAAQATGVSQPTESGLGVVNK